MIWQSPTLGLLVTLSVMSACAGPVASEFDPKVGESSDPPITLLITGSATSATRPEQTGSAKVVVDTVAADRGVLSTGPTPDGHAAFRFPVFIPSNDVVPRVVIRVVSEDTRDDSLAPGKAPFSFGATFRLDSISEGRALDNGNNLLQRGISGDGAQFKVEVDALRPACTVTGADGSLIVRAFGEIAPDTWYEVKCERQWDQVTVAVTNLEQRSVSVRTERGPTGALDYPGGKLPLSIGGKIWSDGQIAESQTDQFNGLVFQPYLNIEDGA